MTAIDMGTSGSMGDFVPDKGLSLSTKKLVFEQTCNKSATVIPSRETLPVLKNFLFEAVDGTLKVVATDLELSVIASSQIVSIEREGRVIFPARKMLDILREASEDDRVLDETFAALSVEYEGRLAEFIRELVDRTETQVLLVTHSDAYSDYADNVYRFSLDSRGRTQVKEGPG